MENEILETDNATPEVTEADEPQQPCPSTPPAEETPAADEPDLDTLIAEAEQRGYLRGRNERIEELMQEPGELEAPSAPATDSPLTGGNEILILNNMRRSVWD